MNDQQRAREFLALGLDEFGHHTEAANVRKGIDLDCYRTELWAITAALRAAPEGFVLVPVESVAPCGCGCHRHCCRYCGYELGGFAARPQGVKG